MARIDPQLNSAAALATARLLGQKTPADRITDTARIASCEPAMDLMRAASAVLLGDDDQSPIGHIIKDYVEAMESLRKAEPTEDDLRQADYAISDLVAWADEIDKLTAEAIDDLGGYEE